MNEESATPSRSGHRSWLKYDGKRMTVAPFFVIAWSVMTAVLVLSLTAPPRLRMGAAPLLLFFHIPIAIVSLVGAIYGAVRWKITANRPSWLIPFVIVLTGTLLVVLPLVLYRILRS